MTDEYSYAGPIAEKDNVNNGGVMNNGAAPAADTPAPATTGTHPTGSTV
jgi:hypothetical protein